jgi:hypothetical protein
MGAYVERIGEMGNAYKVLVGKHEGKWPLGIRRRGWEDGVRVDIRVQSGFIRLRTGSSVGL